MEQVRMRSKDVTRYVPRLETKPSKSPQSVAALKHQQGEE